ncbi:MAG: amidase [Bacteroidales bacterium]|nr:amidase [Bacteroidales bacterium]
MFRLHRRQFLTGMAIGPTAMLVRSGEVSAAIPPFPLGELSIAELQTGLDSARFTSVALVEQYQARIAAIDRAGPRLRSVLETNPDALALARTCDAERKANRGRGSLHGMPILIKDNIATADKMQTTAGSLALVDARPPQDAHVVRQLRAAGGVLLGKTNLSEWANFRSSRSTSGWSARGGQTKNPYVLDRNPSGSSSGSAVAVAAGLCAGAIGTETDGSIVSPASHCGIVGLKPTVGLIGRTGIIPIAASQDTAGPMTRTVRDAAILLNALVGPDADDPATHTRKPAPDYTRFLDPKGLQGARIGVVRRYFGFSPAVDRLLAEALTALQSAGAVLVDPVGDEDFCRFGSHEITVLLYEFRAGLNAYLATLGPTARVRTLADLIAFNTDHADREMPFFGQELLLRAEQCGPLTEKKYQEARATCLRFSRAEGIDRVMDMHKLDALVAPTNGPAAVVDLLYSGRGGGGGGCSSAAAVAGYPHITVPAGFVQELPVGLSFFGRAWSEPTLLKLAYAYEQATHKRRPPRFLPYLEFDGM